MILQEPIHDTDKIWRVPKHYLERSMSEWSSEIRNKSEKVERRAFQVEGKCVLTPQDKRA